MHGQLPDERVAHSCLDDLIAAPIKQQCLICGAGDRDQSRAVHVHARAYTVELGLEELHDRFARAHLSPYPTSSRRPATATFIYCRCCRIRRTIPCAAICIAWFKCSDCVLSTTGINVSIPAEVTNP